MFDYIVGTDGSYSTKTGDIGLGVVIKDVRNNIFHEHGKYVEASKLKSNDAEMLAIHFAISLIPPGSYIQINTDSKFCILKKATFVAIYTKYRLEFNKVRSKKPDGFNKKADQIAKLCRENKDTYINLRRKFNESSR